MPLIAPPIDSRDAQRILRQLLGDSSGALPGLRTFYTPAWTGRTGDDPGYVLSVLFSRLVEILIERLNRVPEKNFIAFLDLLGIDRLPGNPARAPVRFSLPAGNTTGGFVPAGAQVVTGPAPSGATYVFETERGLFLTPVKLQRLFALVPASDSYQDASFAIDAAGTAAIDFAAAGTPIEHSLYVAHDTLLSFGSAAELVVEVTPAAGGPAFTPGEAEWSVAWERYVKGPKGAAAWEKMTPVAGAGLAARLLGAGQVIFPGFSGTAQSPVGTAAEGGGPARWIRAHLETALVPAVFPGGAGTLPRLHSLRLGLTIRRFDLAPDAAFFNAVPVDLSKDFAPFGMQPKLADTFYFASSEALSQPGASVTLRVEQSQGVPAVPSADLELRWEVWNGVRWQEVAVSDGSAQFSVGATSSPPAGEIRFTVPATVAPVAVNGLTGYWGRVRIVQGNYGEPASYTVKPGTTDEFVFVPESFRPPLLSRISLDYEKPYPLAQPEKAVTLNTFRHANRAAALAGAGPDFPPFEPPPETAPALYLGFDSAFGDRAIGLFFRVAEQPASVASGAQAPGVAWEYSGPGGSWPRLEVLEDATAGLANSGVLSFFGAPDAARAERFGQSLFWIRARFAAAPTGSITGVFLNTVQAVHRTTMTDEVLGSGNGVPGQTVSFSQRPVLEGELVYVRETERPSDEAIAALADAEEERLARPLTSAERDALVVLRRDPATGASETWVRWQQVPSFLRSGPASRHYVLDRVAGTLSFGTGTSGMLPPIGRNNIRVFFYRAGGGAAASREVTAGAVKQLRSPLPFVGAVTNLLDAAGGSDPETVADVLERGPQTIRNRDRAVTVEDYVWLARQASTLVNRARCLPTRNARLEFEPGSVAVLIVPQSDQARPYPSRELLRTVRDYLVARSLPGIQVAVLPPQYREVRVTAEVVPLRPEEANVVEGRLLAALDRFLHPVNGGPKSAGWEFGRDVPLSEVHQVMENVAGVDVVLSVELNGAPAGVEIGDNELPAPGTHRIEMRPRAAAG